MKMEINIRKANKGDLKQYINLVSIANNELQRIIQKKIKYTYKEIIKDFKKDLKDKIILVAEYNNKIRGYLVGSIQNQYSKKVGHIHILFVLTKFRKKCIAKSLINEFIKFLKKNKIKRVKLNVNVENKNAIKVYKKINFKITRHELNKEI